MTDPTEEHLAATLRDRAARARVSDDAWTAIMRRAARARSRALRLRFAAISAVAAVAVLAVATPLLLDARRGGDPAIVLTEPPVLPASPQTASPQTEAPQSTSPPTPTATATIPVAPPPAPSPPADWEGMDDGALATEEFTYVEDVVAFAGRVVAVGSFAPEGALLPRGAVWISDGQSWSLADAFGAIDTDNTAIYALAEGNGALVAVGESSGPSAWRSTDGLAWGQVTLPGDGVVRDVAWTGQRFVAVGEDSDRGPIVWRSADGTAWESLALEPGGPEDVLDHVAVSADLVVALGRASVAASPDGGVTWTQRLIADAGFGAATTALEDLAALADGSLLAVAVNAEGGPTAYGSTDGQTWSLRGAVDPGTGETRRVSELLAAEDGTIVAVGGSAGQPSRALVWTSSDGGMTWAQAPDPRGTFGDGTWLLAVTRTDAGLVAVGTDDSRGAAWVLRDSGP